MTTPLKTEDGRMTRVKPLEWRAWESLASSCVGLYCITHGGDRFYLRFRDKYALGDFSTPDEAKAAAEAHYQQQVLSALLPDTRDDLIKSLVEAATGVIATDEDFRSNMPTGWEGDPLTDAVDTLRSTLNLARNQGYGHE